MWSLIVIGLKLHSASCPWGPIHRVPKFDLDLLRRYLKSIGFFLSTSTTYIGSLNTKTVVCIVAYQVLYTECQSWPWPLSMWPKINRVPPLIIHTLHVKFKSVKLAKTVVCIVSTRQKRDATDWRMHATLKLMSNTVGSKNVNDKYSYPIRILHRWYTGLREMSF